MALRLNMPHKYHQGYYKLFNPDKYVGDPDQIAFRSSYEKKFCHYCDLNPKIKKWGSEVIKIPYIGPDNRQHNYHVDFYIEFDDPNSPTGSKKLVIEVKPSNELSKPKTPKRWTRKAMENYEYQMKMFEKNLYKWRAAKRWAEDRGYQFVIVNEEHLQNIR